MSTTVPVMPIYAEHWGGGVICNFSLFSTLGGEARPRFFSREVNMTNFQHASGQIKFRQKRSSLKIEQFLSPNLSEEQKKVLYRKLKSICPRNHVKTKKSSKHHPALRCRPWTKYWGDAGVDHSQIIGGGCSQIIGGYILRGFRYPCTVRKFSNWNRTEVYLCSTRDA